MVKTRLPYPRNYLRVRGEYMGIQAFDSEGKELPPRARRILPLDTHIIVMQGTTSACAENTH